jgi:hypothetical protein
MRSLQRFAHTIQRRRDLENMYIYQENKDALSDIKSLLALTELSPFARVQQEAVPFQRGSAKR